MLGFIIVAQPLYLLPIERQLTITLTLVMTGLFYYRPFLKFSSSRQSVGRVLLFSIDSVFAIAAVAAGIYITLYYDAIIFRQGAFTAADSVFAVILVFLALDSVRRSVGWPLTVVCTAALAYAMFGRIMPGAFFHRGYTVERITQQLALSFSGLYGIPLRIMVRYVILFIAFGTLLSLSGAADFLVRFSTSLAGRYVGGHGKVAVLASGLIGSISGSAAGNVATTGSVTIPAMKSAGYKPHFAASIEAVASTGGQIMPPIMGAAAFLMSDYLGVSYITVVKAAVVPAFLYFFSAGTAIDVYARSEGILGLPKSAIPSPWSVAKNGWGYLGLILLVYGLLIGGYSPTRAAFIGVIAAFAFSLFRKVGLRSYMQALFEGAESSAKLCAVTAGSGIVVGVIQLTGLGAQLAGSMVDMSNGHLFVLLVLVMITSIILGMGMPTTVVYVLLAALVTPALAELGVDLIGAHFFSFYFGVMAAITPPVALASYAAASIAGSSFDKTGWTAFKMAAPAFIIPFFFAGNPALMMNGTFLEIIYAVICAAAGVWMISAAAMNYFRGKLPWWNRITIIIGALMFIRNNTAAHITGYVILLGFLISRFSITKKRRVEDGCSPGTDIR